MVKAGRVYRFESCSDYTANDVERDSISFKLVMVRWRKEDANRRKCNTIGYQL